MKSFIKVCLIFLIVHLTQACAYMAVSDKINGTEETYKLRSLETAYKSDKGNLSICLSGKTEDDTSEFWLNVPIKQIANLNPNLWTQERISAAYERWYMPKERIEKRNCDIPPPDHHIINTVTLDRPEQFYSNNRLHEALSFNALNSAEIKPSVYLIFDRDREEDTFRYYELAYADKNMVFKRDSSIFVSGYNSTFIDIEPYCINCNKLWYAAVPFAIIVDILLAPITIFLLFNGDYS
jgi:hypothetical protein